MSIQSFFKVRHFSKKIVTIFSMLAMISGGAILLNLTSAQAQVANSIATVNIFKQDYSDCTNSDVPNTTSSSTVTGYIYVIKSEFDGKLFAEVHLNKGTPNTKYNIFLKCKQKIGELSTDNNGVGAVVVMAPLNIVPAVFAFDMYPDGAPLGNKFQSVQVR